MSTALVALTSMAVFAAGPASADGPDQGPPAQNTPSKISPGAGTPAPDAPPPEAAPAAAAPEASADQDEGGVEKVVVTSTRRETILQNTPLAVTAVGKKALAAANIENIQDLVALVPSLVVTNNGNAAAYTARIRGIGTQGNNPGLESAVGTFIDGVYRNRASVAFGDLGELERIEVLRGPQGTLFGRNTSAGIMSVITKKPSFVDEFSIEGTASSFDGYAGRGMVNYVLAEDELAARFNFTRQEQEGFIDVNPGRPDAYDGNAQSYYNARGQVLWQITEDADLRVIADYSKRNDQCCSAVTVTPGGNGRALGAVAPFTTSTSAPTAINVIEGPLSGKGTTNQVDSQIAFGNRSTDTDVEDKGVSAELNWDIQGAKLTSITALREWDAAYGQDADFSGADMLYFPDDGSNYNKFKTVTHETRITGEAGWVNWLFGVYFADEDLTRSNTLTAGSELEAFLSLHRVGDVPGALRGALNGAFAHPLITPVFTPGTGDNDFYEQNAQSFALFTHNVFHLDDNLDFIAGVRWTTEEKTYDATYRTSGANGCASIEALYGLDPITNVATNTGPASVPTRLATITCLQSARHALDVLTASAPHHQERTEDEFSGTATLAWALDEDVNTYATYSRGHKAGGFNLDRIYSDAAGSIVSNATFAVPGVVPAQTVRAPDTSFGAEFVDAFELGLKTAFDDSLFVNTAVFYQKFEDFQLNSFTGTAFIVTSIPEVISQGVEVEAFWSPVRAFSTNFSVQYTDAHYGDLGAAFVAARPELFLLDGAQVSSAPEWTLTGGLDYSVPFVDNFTARFHADARWQSETNTGANLDPRKEQDAYTVVGVKLGLYSENERVGLEIFARNLFDENYINTSFDSPLQGSTITSTAPVGTSTIDAFVGEPRMIGATLRIKS
ncbi:MAG: TonB-dependent receptor [Alphaproteobacteria bacterium]|nr:TonB-dependent receptor [Alphaproteobacteria bacterium]